MKSGFSANLDVLRSIAVLLVLIQHLLNRAYVEHLSWVPTSCLGYFGVLLFFVHTTLVLMFSLERHGESFKDFYVRRLFRIYPLAIVAVLAALVLHLDSGVNGVNGLSRAGFPGKRELLGNLFLVQNLVRTRAIVNVLWSLPFELQMYGVLPIIFLMVKRWKLKGAVALWVISVPLAWKFSLLQFGPCFLAGAICFVLVKRSPRLPAYLWPCFILGLLLVFSLHPDIRAGWILCLVLGCAAPLFTEVTHSVVRLVAGRIALYSYGIYISHQFCIWFATDVLARWPGAVKVLFLVISLCALPILLYHSIEKPFIDWGKKLTRKTEPVPQFSEVVLPLR